MNIIELITKHPLSESEKSIQTGGKSGPNTTTPKILGENLDEPNGGFPPIYACLKSEVDTTKPQQTEMKKKEFQGNNNLVNIKQIMFQRKKNPFVTD